LTELVEAGRFEEAVRFLKGWEDETWQQFGAQFVWFKWAEHDRDQARDFLKSEQLSTNVRLSAASALFRGMAARTSPEDVEWVKEFLTRHYESASVPAVEGEVARLWVATGVISVEDFVTWAKADDDAHLATWIQALAGAPHVGVSYSLEGLLSKGDLLKMAGSCLGVTRELQPMIEGADMYTINPKAELAQKVSYLLNQSGKAMAQVLGASDLSAYPAPENGQEREQYFAGVGRQLGEESIGTVQAVVSAFPDAELAGVVWSQYLDERIGRCASPQMMVEDSAKLDAGGGFRDQLIDAFVDKHFDAGMEPLIKAVEALPAGDARDRYALGIAREWTERGNPQEARRWLDQVKNRALVPAAGGE